MSEAFFEDVNLHENPISHAWIQAHETKYKLTGLLISLSWSLVVLVKSDIAKNAERFDWIHTTPFITSGCEIDGVYYLWIEDNWFQATREARHHEVTDGELIQYAEILTKKFYPRSIVVRPYVQLFIQYIRKYMDKLISSYNY